MQEFLTLSSTVRLILLFVGFFLKLKINVLNQCYLIILINKLFKHGEDDVSLKILMPDNSLLTLMIQKNSNTEEVYKVILKITFNSILIVLYPFVIISSDGDKEIVMDIRSSKVLCFV